MKDFVDALGGIVSTLVIIAFGASIYIFYRYVLGEFLIYPFTHFIHYLFDKKNEPTSPTGYLRRIKKLKIGQVREAYTDIRRHFFEEKLRDKLDLDHSEIHLLWLTSVIGIFLFIYLSLVGNTDCMTRFSVFIASIFVYIAATIIDIKQHKKEYRLISEPSRQSDLDNFLNNHGYYIKKQPQKTAAE
ncbi:hypothetical protein ES703_92034 [subsurface metagenome]